MAGGRGIDGLALGAIGAGGLFLYAAVSGRSILGSVQALIRGTAPASAPVTSPIIGSAPAAGSAPVPGAFGSLAENIPAGKGSYNQAGLVALWTDNGGPSDTAAFAAAVAIAESGGQAAATSNNPDGGINSGIFQLDTKGVGSGYTAAELQDPNLNTQITIMATDGGTNWTEWGDPVTAAVGYHYTPGAPIP